MANDDGQPVYINGHRWMDVTDETVASPVYTEREVRAIDGDPRRAHELPATSEPLDSR